MAKFLFYMEFENGECVVTRGLSKTRAKNLYNTCQDLSNPTVKEFGYRLDDDLLSTQILIKNATVLD